MIMKGLTTTFNEVMAHGSKLTGTGALARRMRRDSLMFSPTPATGGPSAMQPLFAYDLNAAAYDPHEEVVEKRESKC